MSENNDNSNESSSLGSDSLLQSSRLTGGGGVGIGNPVVRTGVLRPSVLGPSRLGSSLSSTTSISNNSNNVSSTSDAHENNSAATSTGKNDGAGDAATESEEPSSNPFLKDLKDEDANASESAEAESKEDDKTEQVDVEERPDPLSLLRKNGMERANLFAAAKTSIPLVEQSGFVFGQNVHERVVGENVKCDKSEAVNNDESDDFASNRSDLLFSNVIQNAAAKSAENAAEASAGKESNAEAKSLTDVAREYEESRAQKRKYEEVETFTGEENEVNIVDLNCKLFAFVNSNWEERGRGGLRLNDSKIENECSRLVFRTAGNLRLLLNTKVWAGMVAERPSQKSLRLTAMDNSGKIKIYLLMARPAEINQLHSALVERIDKRKQSHPDELCAAGGTVDSSDNNGNHENIRSLESDAKHAASVAEPEHDEPTDPSPKKCLISVEVTSNVPDSSDN